MTPPILTKLYLKIIIIIGSAIGLPWHLRATYLYQIFLLFHENDVKYFLSVFTITIHDIVLSWAITFKHIFPFFPNNILS